MSSIQWPQGGQGDARLHHDTSSASARAHDPTQGPLSLQLGTEFGRTSGENARLYIADPSPPVLNVAPATEDARSIFRLIRQTNLDRKANGLYDG